jgi:hypothetical protein
MSVKSACVIAAIGVTTLNEWREQHPELQDRLVKSREFARQKALAAIRQAGDRDWRAHADWLWLTFPADYRGRGSRIEVSATASVCTVIHRGRTPSFDCQAQGNAGFQLKGVGTHPRTG